MKPKSTHAWGRETAKERYNLTQDKLPDVAAAHNMEAPQFPEDQRGEKYSNRTSGWVRGAKGEPTMKNETAEGKPSFDHSRKGK